MPSENHWSANGLYRKFTGDIDGTEIFESNLELHQNPLFNQIRYIINDFSEIKNFDFNTKYLEVLASTDVTISQTKGALKIANIISTDEQKEIALIYQRLMQGKRFLVETFNNRDQAQAWVEQN